MYEMLLIELHCVNSFLIVQTLRFCYKTHDAFEDLMSEKGFPTLFCRSVKYEYGYESNDKSPLFKLVVKLTITPRRSLRKKGAAPDCSNLIPEPGLAS